MLKAIRKNRGFTLIELMIVVAIIGILAAIAIPNFIKFQAKSKQSEAKTNLKAIFTAEKAYYGEKDTFNTSFATIGYQPEKGNRYNYIAGGTAITQDTVRFGAVPAGAAASNTTVTNGTAISSAPGVGGTAPSVVFEAAAYGNVDNDTALDAWTIGSDTNTQGITTCSPDGTAAGGVPLVAYDDVACP